MIRPTIEKFGIFCKNCLEKSKVNVHHDQLGRLFFTCFNCGSEEQFPTDVKIDKTTKEDWVETNRNNRLD